MKGIDISAWQENIDWQALVDVGIEFVIVKLGQNCRLDEKFVENINAAIEHGLKVGVYYYAKATTPEEAQQEADWVNEQIKQYLDGKCPELGIWYDVEDPSLEGSDITAICNSFVGALNTAGYDCVGVYSSYNWLTNGNINIDDLPADTPLWCAQYNSECDFENPNLKIWQFTDHYSDELPYDGDEYYD